MSDQPPNELHRAPPELQSLSPRVKRALRAYGTGVATQGQAADAVGITQTHLSIASHSRPGREYLAQLDAQLEARTLDMSAVMEKLSQKALIRMAEMMDSGSDHIAFKATQDILDRGPRTTKVQKVQTESLSLSGRDVQALAAAMVASAGLHAEYPEATTGNYVKVPDALSSRSADAEESPA